MCALPNYNVPYAFAAFFVHLQFAWIVKFVLTVLFLLHAHALVTVHHLLSTMLQLLGPLFTFAHRF